MRRVRERDVLYVMQALEENISFDKRPCLSIRVNDNGRQCIRCEAETRGKSWLLDIYGKHFFYLSVPPHAPVTPTTVRSLMLHLQVLLGESHASSPSTHSR